MSVVNIISAVGNNSSVYPLLVRDCGIEIPSKLAMTYSQNLKDSPQMANNALRERGIDEYGTSFIWIGGIPFCEKLCDKGIRKLGYNPDINPNLFKENSKQGMKFNIDKFKNSATSETKELEKVLKNKKTFQRLLAAKFIISTAIPVSLMGYFLPKANFALTEKIRNKQQKNKQSDEFNLGLVDCLTESKREKNVLGNNTPSFKGGAISTLSNLSTVNKMAITDGGLTVGRVATARNKYEKMEMGFKMLSMMFLNFVAPIWISKGLDKLSNKLYKTNVNLDPKLLNDSEFLTKIKENNLKLPKNNIIEFLDKNPNEKFSKLTEEYCGVKYLKNRVRDPRNYVDEKKISVFQSEIEKFSKQALESGNIDKFAQKALKVKSANIVANVCISSFLLAAALPKLIFMLRKQVTGSEAEPGLVR
jgi:hypothetical protein